MKQNRFFQIWSFIMAKSKNESTNVRKLSELNIEFTPAIEPIEDFQKRKEEVQLMLTDMFKRLHKMGRPKKNDGDESYAA